MPSDRNETCPTCGSNKRHVFIGPPCILSPDDTYDPWHDSEPDGWVHDGTCCTNAAGMPNCFDPAPTPAPRCPYFSRAWGVRCDRPAGHDGACQSSGDVFASGYIPDAAPPPAPRDETPTDGGVVLWREDRDGSWHAESDLIRDTGRSIIGRKYIAVPAAQRQRERDVIEALRLLLAETGIALTESVEAAEDSSMWWGGGGREARMPYIESLRARIDAALRRGESKED